MKKKIDFEIVASHGERTLYAVLRVDGKPLKNQLWCLTHPGNEAVNEWKDKTVVRDRKEVNLSTKEFTNNFFSKCVRPVDREISAVEGELIKKYGLNNSPKPRTINDVPIWAKETWESLSDSFLDGSLFLQAAQFEFVTDSTEGTDSV